MRKCPRTNHGVNFLFGEQIQEFCKQHAACGIENKGDQAKAHNHQGLWIQKGLPLHFSRNSKPQQQSNQVRQFFLRRLGKAAQHAAFPDQVAKHQKSRPAPPSGVQ